jgi:chloramphenicol 3-O-phosphotransferase
MNNNRSNYAVVNGFDIAHLLGVRTPRPPEPILRRMEERDGALPGWVREAAEPPAPPALEGSRQRGSGPVVAQSKQLHLDV